MSRYNPTALDHDSLQKKAKLPSNFGILGYNDGKFLVSYEENGKYHTVWIDENTGEKTAVK